MIRFLTVLLFACRLFAAGCDLLVQGAVDDELEPLLAVLEHKKEVRIAAWTFWTGAIASQSVVISRTEVGPINAAAATALGIREFHPAAVINQGTAGATDPRLRLFDIVLGERSTDYSARMSAHGDQGAGVNPARWRPLTHQLRLDGRLVRFPSFPGDTGLIAAAQSVRYTRGRVVPGNIGSAFQYNRELDYIQWLRQTYGISSEDMESAFAAGVATGMKVPFLAIRIISDSEWNHPKFEPIAGQYCAQFVLDVIRRKKN